MKRGITWQVFGARTFSMIIFPSLVYAYCRPRSRNLPGRPGGLPSTLGYLPLFIPTLGLHLAGERLGIQELCFQVWGTTTLFSKVAAPLDTPTSDRWGMTSLRPHQHLLLSDSWIVANLVGVSPYLTGLLLCTPLPPSPMVPCYVFVSHSCVFLREMSVEILCPFLSWTNCCISIEP